MSIVVIQLKFNGFRFCLNEKIISIFKYCKLQSHFDLIRQRIIIIYIGKRKKENGLFHYIRVWIEHLITAFVRKFESRVTYIRLDSSHAKTNFFPLRIGVKTDFNRKKSGSRDRITIAVCFCALTNCRG